MSSKGRPRFFPKAVARVKQDENTNTNNDNNDNNNNNNNNNNHNERHNKRDGNSPSPPRHHKGKGPLPSSSSPSPSSSSSSSSPSESRTTYSPAMVTQKKTHRLPTSSGSSDPSVKSEQKDRIKSENVREREELESAKAAAMVVKRMEMDGEGGENIDENHMDLSMDDTFSAQSYPPIHIPFASSSSSSVSSPPLSLSAVQQEVEGELPHFPTSTLGEYLISQYKKSKMDSLSASSSSSSSAPSPSSSSYTLFQLPTHLPFQRPVPSHSNSSSSLPTPSWGPVMPNSSSTSPLILPRSASSSLHDVDGFSLSDNAMRDAPPSPSANVTPSGNPHVAPPGVPPQTHQAQMIHLAELSKLIFHPRLSNALRYLPSGQMGELVFRKSGKVQLALKGDWSGGGADEMYYINLSSPMDYHFHCGLLSVDSKNHSAYELGNITHRCFASYEIDQLQKEMEKEQQEKIKTEN